MAKNVEQEHKNIGWDDYIRPAAVTIEGKGWRNTCSWNLKMDKRSSVLKRIASTAYIFTYFYVSRREITAVFEFASSERKFIYALMLTDCVLCL